MFFLSKLNTVRCNNGNRFTMLWRARQLKLLSFFLQIFYKFLTYATFSHHIIPIKLLIAMKLFRKKAKMQNLHFVQWLNFKPQNSLNERKIRFCSRPRAIHFHEQSTSVERKTEKNRWLLNSNFDCQSETWNDFRCLKTVNSVKVVFMQIKRWRVKWFWRL